VTGTNGYQFGTAKSHRKTFGFFAFQSFLNAFTFSSAEV
jgi:hypothetical protein